MSDKMDELIREAFKKNEMNEDTKVALARFYERLNVENDEKANGKTLENKVMEMSKYKPQIDKNLPQVSKKSKVLKYQKYIIACGLILAFFAGSLFTEKATAINSFLKDRFDINGNLFISTIKKDDGKGEVVKPNNEEFDTIEEAKLHASFVLKIPQYIPDSLKFNKVVINRIDNLENVEIFYENESDYLKVHQYLANDDTSAVVGAINTNGTVKSIYANNREYKIIIINQDRMVCQYPEQNIVIQLSSKGLEIKQFEKILLSIK